MSSTLCRQVLLISDPETKSSAAAMDIHVGHFSDPGTCMRLRRAPTPKTLYSELVSRWSRKIPGITHFFLSEPTFGGTCTGIGSSYINTGEMTSSIDPARLSRPARFQRYELGLRRSCKTHDLKELRRVR